MSGKRHHSMSALLRLESVTKSFGAVRALKGITFDLRPGEVHALVGENGAGKSTLIKLITGAHAPDSGVIEMGGAPVGRLDPSKARKLGVACIYQQPALFADLTVAEVIALRLEPPAPLRRVHWRERRARASELLKEIGASISPEAEVSQLSGPEQQLVEICCALGAGARILILDEPTASLTQQEEELLFAIVRQLRAAGVGIIYISHRLEEIFALADRVTVLRDGQSVGTHAVADLDEAALIRLMIGRDMSHLYPPPEGEPREVVLSIKKLGSRAGGVRDISLEVRAGEIVGLAGLVGAGRTELARVLFGLTPADAGEIRIGGEQVEIGSPEQAIAAGVAYVPEDRRRHGVILEMPVAANITLAAPARFFAWGWLRFGVERRAALESMRELDVRAAGPEALVQSLSGGNQQKVSLARWLATQPRVLILDEPTQGVDVGAKSEIHRILRRLAQAGMAVVMISSDLPEILGMSDRIALMRGGAIVAMLPGKATAPQVMAAALGQGTVDS